MGEMKIKIRKTVFYPTILITVLFLIGYLCSPNLVNTSLEMINDAFRETFGWFYLVVALFLVIVSFIVVFSKFGGTKIGGENAEPKLSTKNWFTIVLCTTIAAGLIFWGACEPIYHFMAPPDFLEIKPGTHDAAVFSMTTMFLHWMLTPYAIYTVPALMFAIAVYNQNRPFSFSSCISGIFPSAERNTISSVIDSLCVFCTVMGMIASLGQGILSIAGGLTESTGKSVGRNVWIIIGVVIVTVFIISACSGIMKGIKWISNINTVFLLALLLLVFVAGPTAYIIQLSMESFGVYIDNFFTRSLMIGAGENNDWSYFWTISTFANWMAWAPVTGMFLGKISYGHSVRKFIGINLIATACCSALWVNIFGGTAIYQQKQGIDLYEKMNQAGMESGVYLMLKSLPFGKILIVLLIFTVALSVITAADSTTNILGDLSCIGREEGIKSVKVIWGLLIGGLAILLICYQGITGIKTMSVIGGIPAVFLLLFTGISILKTVWNNRRDKNEKDTGTFRF